MPAPGSSHALVVPSGASAIGDPQAGARITKQLEQFLEETKYSAVAVVHGLSDSASDSFDLAKTQRPAKGGVIWVTDQAFLANLTGRKAAKLRTLLKPKPAYVMSFFSVVGQRITGHLHWSQIGEAEVDLKFANAALNVKDPA